MIVVLSTCSTQEEAEKLAQVLVENCWAACVQIGTPIQSHYKWQNKMCTELEIPLRIKTHQKVVSQLKEAFIKLHSYETPQWIELEAKASEGYLKWVEESLGI